jgi:hypothetical protein
LISIHQVSGFAGQVCNSCGAGVLPLHNFPHFPEKIPTPSSWPLASPSASDLNSSTPPPPPPLPPFSLPSNPNCPSPTRFLYPPFDSSIHQIPNISSKREKFGRGQADLWTVADVVPSMRERERENGRDSERMKK